MRRTLILLTAAALAIGGPLTTPAHAQPANPLPCGPHPEYGGFFCDLNDIAGLFSTVLDTTLSLTCLDREKNIIICRRRHG